MKNHEQVIKNEDGFLFDFSQFKINKKIRLIELFGGIGSQAMALRDIGADFEHYKLVEFDKYAVTSYNAIHNTQHTTHDIRDIHAKDLEITEKDKYCYLMTYSFPCTDLSVAGKMQGMSKEDWQKENATRSGLLWEVERILKECTKEELPDVLLMENVPQVHAEQNENDFKSWLNFLKSKGYKNFWQDLNAKDFSIPQNRIRCFCVSFLSNDDFMEFTFPEPVKLEKVMKDFLEETVDEKYYIKNEKADKLIKGLIESGVLGTENREQRTENREIIRPLTCLPSPLGKSELQTVSKQDMTQESATYRQTEAVLLTEQGRRFEKKTDIATCLMARDYKGFGNQEANGVITTMQGWGREPMIIDTINDEVSEKMIVAMRGRNPENPTDRTLGIKTEQRLEPAPQGVDNTLTTLQKDNLCLEIKQATKEGTIKCKVGGCYDASYPESTTRRGRVKEDGDITPTITAQGGENINFVETVYRIRKLTPKECWRLMGYTDEDFEKAYNAGVSNSQLYKQAGNAIVKQVLMAIFSQML